MKLLIKDKNDTLVLKNLSRRRAVKELCLNCSAWSPSQRTNCPVTDCPLRPYRNGEIPEGLTAADRARALRTYCLEGCCCGDRTEVRDCAITTCAIRPWRRSKVDRSMEVGEVPA